MSARRRFRGLLHRAFLRSGVDVTPLSSARHPLGRRLRLLAALDVDLLVDVGANAGQFGMEMRTGGYRGRILSIEPLGDAFGRLLTRSQADVAWTAVRSAVGASDQELTMHIARNSASSSFLEMLPIHLRAAPGTEQVGHETVPVRRLDSVLAAHATASRRVYLKIDVQGYELEVLRGAGESLRAVVATQLELSLARLYANSPLAHEVDAFVSKLGYRLAGVEPGLAEPDSGRLLQMDGIYVRSDALASLPGGYS